MRTFLYACVRAATIAVSTAGLAMMAAQGYASLRGWTP